MNQTGRIMRLVPNAALSGGEFLLECSDLHLTLGDSFEVRCDGVKASLLGTSSRRVTAIVPPELIDETRVSVDFVWNGNTSNKQYLTVGELLADDLHLVANPAYSPVTGELYLTRSGSRGQELPVTLFKLDAYGDLHEISGDIMNPTGLAFDRTGQLFVSSRADGIVYRVTALDAVPFARNLGVATDLAFDFRGDLYVGDRTGTIHRINPLGEAQAWVEIEPSVAAYHLAFGPDDALYVAGPTVSSNDAIVRITPAGRVEKFFSGFMRPQGLAFDRAGNLYVVACYRGRRGVWRIPSEADDCELILAASNLVGLCFNEEGDLIAGAHNAVYRVPLGITGWLPTI